jgi:hypothetical protein
MTGWVEQCSCCAAVLALIFSKPYSLVISTAASMIISFDIFVFRGIAVSPSVL